MTDYLTDEADGVIPLVPLTKERFESWLESQADSLKRWIEATEFKASGGEVCLVADADGGLERVLVGLAERPDLWDWAPFPTKLPAGTYRLDDGAEVDVDLAALGWALGTYRFRLYKEDGGNGGNGTPATLVWPDGADRDEVARAVEATVLVRDLINTPAEDMGPGNLAEAARALGERFGADVSVTEGDELLAQGWPAVHAVGRAAHRPPCLIDLVWGPESGPKVTLVGKGVCFDTGGLDIKPANFMKLMKKDMGGAAHVLGIASMVMAAELPVRLRVLIPAVENSVSGNAMRPGDVVKTRKGLTVEIGHTDAEGRVILADALAEAVSEEPEALIDFATLTGAARVALGTEVPALFCNDDELAAGLMLEGEAEADPLWRLPLWPGYRKMVEGKVADLTNDAESSYGGAITAALFLERFVGTDSPVPWAHIDLMAWNTKAGPGRPEGGEAMGMRAVFAWLEGRFGG